MRDTAFWTDANVRLLKEHFVAVAVNGMSMNNRKDADKEFICDICQLRLAGAGGNMIVVSAGGKQLGGKNGVNSNLTKAWDEWNALAEAERKPGAIQVPEAGPTDPEHGPALLPPGTLVLKEHYRLLAKADQGYRYLTGKDFPSEHWSLKQAYWYEAAPDFLWIPESEWKALVPAQAKKGDSFSMPAAIAERIFRFHLVPTMALGESNGWSPRGKDLRAGEMKLTVEDVTTNGFKLRLDGFAHLGAVFNQAECEKRGWQQSGGVGYEPRLLGYLEYDVKKGAFTRFDVVALGAYYGTLGGDLRYFYRPGRTPLGITFELVSADVPANRVPPMGLREREMKSHAYLGAAK